MRVLTVVNDRAGGLTGLYEFVRRVGLTGAEVVMRFVTDSARVEDLVADATSFDRIVAVGGDGTASAVCYATRNSSIPILVYPAGTANLLAGNLGMPTEPPALANVLLEGRALTFDVGELERQTAAGAGPERTGFTIMAGAGYDATIMKAAEPMKSSMGAAAYLFAAVSNPTPTPARFELKLDGEHVSTDGIAVLIANFGRIQFDLPVTPGTDPRDGRFEVAVIRTRNVVGLLPVVAAAFLDLAGDHPDRSENLDVYQASVVEVSAYPQLRMQADGDSLELLTPFAARVLPGAATLIVGPEAPFAAEDE